jgi:hypothetical protein
MHTIYLRLKCCVFVLNVSSPALVKLKNVVVIDTWCNSAHGMPGVQTLPYVVPLTLDRCHGDVGANVNLAFFSCNLGLVFRNKLCLYCLIIRRSVAHIIISYKLEWVLIHMYTIKMNRGITVTESNNLAEHRVMQGSKQTC